MALQNHYFTGIHYILCTMAFKIMGRGNELPTTFDNDFSAEAIKQISSFVIIPNYNPCLLSCTSLHVLILPVVNNVLLYVST